MHHQNRVKRALVHLRLDGTTAPEPGSAVFAGDVEVGKITDAVVWADHVVAFAYVAANVVRFQEDGSVAATDPLCVRHGSTDIPARLSEGQS